MGGLQVQRGYQFLDFPGGGGLGGHSLIARVMSLLAHIPLLQCLISCNFLWGSWKTGCEDALACNIKGTMGRRLGGKGWSPWPPPRWLRRELRLPHTHAWCMAMN